VNYWEAIQHGKILFSKAGIETPLLDATVLISEASGLRKETIFAVSNDPVPEEIEKIYLEFLGKRLTGLPVSYILNRKEFYSLQFFVDSRVLVPRPDTETLVEYVRSLLAANPRIRSIHDVCTGSGCIPITLAFYFPNLRFSASDISDKALEVCSLNSRKILGREIPLRKSDLFNDVPGRFDMITANPPYLTSKEVQVMREAGWPEPLTALEGGEDGLDLVMRLVTEALESLNESGYLILESAAWQTERIEEIMKDSGYTEIATIQDMAGRNRVVSGRKV
jgi:release factor glutamine methyltransferase